ncbi:ATP-dependent zinc metalloprotease FtsH [Persicimonas caeni]|uniref:ATP-dependent zinc metalloprotease FtsH n=1 Tax=Persicimonas caeni TaxID=2292766 RepID=A0A4Y6PNR2_PERCE|nr:ATP-dependent zinc metalloprotease FtsH [Persicimonas caeni]QDG49647.1 ATP-dependent zinc metalloprotease FtsH [Persicimonas caeni]QED30868.1 ATP-dependent zinc metalloprotease FtsH [Persicimonas caeni]
MNNLQNRGPNQNRPPNPDEEPNQGLFSSRLTWILLLLVLGVMLVIHQLQQPAGKVIPYSELKEKVTAGKVESVTFKEQQKIILAEPTEEALKEAREGTDKEFDVWRTVRVEDDESLVPLLDENNVEVEAQYDPGCDGSFFWIWIAPLFVLFLLWSFFMRRMSGMGGPNSPAMQFGKSKAKAYKEEGTGVTFDDVAGCEEAKAELAEIVEFLQEPEKFTRLGGKVPKGVLLVGPPGTGKTLLARAVAGEADVPFYNLSGSDFVEMFVGVGAARVRDLFEQAQNSAPCIIFVDELDAIGKQRGAGGYQGNDEREQTLNALLVEMDGFDSRSGVILLAATNRPEILDPALLRAGRFDRQVGVDRPDKRGRLAILKVHARSIVVSDDVDLSIVAAQTPGFVGADMANLVNEAALMAARKSKDAVEMTDFQEAIERVIAGLEMKSRRLNEKEKDIVAYHESGHAIVAGALEEADPVHKVSIVSRGIGALGYTLQVPLEDRYLMTRNELRDKICGLLGGRAAEQIIFGDISTGAANDLQRVTDIAKRMVRDYGMSDTLGNVSYGDDSKGGMNPFAGKEYSEDTAITIDREVHELIDDLYGKTVAILEKNRDLLEEMAEHLKENEVLEGDELGEMLGRVLPFEKAADGNVEPRSTARGTAAPESKLEPTSEPESAEDAGSE